MPDCYSYRLVCVQLCPTIKSNICAFWNQPTFAPRTEFGPAKIISLHINHNITMQYFSKCYAQIFGKMCAFHQILLSTTQRCKQTKTSVF